MSPSLSQGKHYSMGPKRSPHFFCGNIILFNTCRLCVDSCLSTLNKEILISNQKSKLLLSKANENDMTISYIKVEINIKLN